MKKAAAAAVTAARKVWFPKKYVESFYSLETECNALDREILKYGLEFDRLNVERKGE